jgi:uncharacterized protein (TIGR02246 family)
MRASLAAVSLVPLLITAACAKSAPAAAPDSTTTAMANGAPAATTTATDPAAARKAILDADAKWAAAEQRGDANAVASVYADSVITLYNGAPAVHGRDAVTKALADRFAKTNLTNVNYHTDDIMVDGNIAVELGSSVDTKTPKAGGKSVTEKGRYMTVWQKQPDGSWKVVRDADVETADSAKHAAQ